MTNILMGNKNVTFLLENVNFLTFKIIIKVPTLCLVLSPRAISLGEVTPLGYWNTLPSVALELEGGTA